MKTHPLFCCVLALLLTFALLTLFVGLAGTAASQPAATTIVVTNTSDNGPGSLRQAILDVETGGTIRFDPSLTGGRILLTSGQLVISRSLTIDASTAVSLTVDGNRAARVFTIAQGATVELIALIITGGQAPSNDEGSVPHGGGILNLGDLTLTGCSVIENGAGPGRSAYYDPSAGSCPFAPATPGGDGGGIFNAGGLVLRQTTVMSNTAGKGGAAIECAPGARGGSGGGISNSSTLELIDSTVQANQAGEGGMLYNHTSPGHGGHGGGLNSTGAVTITRTLIAGNEAGNGYTESSSYSHYSPGSQGGDGGGLYAASASRLIMVDSTVRSNRAGLGEPWQDHLGRSGGGLFNGGFAVVTHSVFFSNRAGEAHDYYPMRADGGDGGAIANRGDLSLRDSVLAGNVTGTGYWGGNGGDGGAVWNRGVATLVDSWLINNMTSRGSNGIQGNFRVGGTPGGRGGDGAALWNDSSLVLLRVTISGNQAGDGGAGGSEWSRAGLAGGRGGAGAGLSNQGVVALVNSTVSGNQAGRGGDGGAPQGAYPGGNGGDGGSGGGIYNSYSLTLDNSTVATNAAGAAGHGAQGSPNGEDGVGGAGGGILGIFAARDTILAGNNAPAEGPDCAGRLAAGGYNLLENPEGCIVDSVVTNNVIGRGRRCWPWRSTLRGPRPPTR